MGSCYLLCISARLEQSVYIQTVHCEDTVYIQTVHCEDTVYIQTVHCEDTVYIQTVHCEDKFTCYNLVTISKRISLSSG